MNARNCNRQILAVAALMVVGCAPASGGAVTPTAPTTPAPVPWIDTTAPASAGPFTIPEIPACTADQLDISIHVANPSYVGAGPVGTQFWAMTVRDHDTRPCFVGPALDVVGLLPPQGHLDVGRTAAGSSDLIYLAPGRVAPQSPYASEATGELSIDCTPPPGTRLQLSPGPGLGTATLDPGPAGGTAPPCSTKPVGAGAELSDGGGSSVVSAANSELAASPSVHRGQRLRFVVTLINHWPGGRSFMLDQPPTPLPTATFTPCPTYHQELEGVAGTFHTFRLNCEAASPIPPSGSESFEMYVDVPADAITGPAVLTWGLDGESVFPVARQYVEVIAD